MAAYLVAQEDPHDAAIGQPWSDDLTGPLLQLCLPAICHSTHRYVAAVPCACRSDEHAGLRHAREERFEVTYKGKIVGEYVADFVVEDRVIVELKAIDRLAPTHVGQVLNYLKASQLLVGLILNFGQPKLEIKRVLAP